ncbi:MAG TPA: hypothetical protein HA260_04755 [Thermoplasmata archaeon]|nr:hypothetical protein [Thermoplasmata archaeon]
MQKKIQKNFRKAMLIITIVSLFVGTCSTITLSSPTKSSPSSEQSTNEKQTPKITIIDENQDNQQQSYSIQYTISFSKEDISIDRFHGYDLVNMKDCTYLTQYGKPLLPAKHLRIALPDGMKATTIQIQSMQKQSLPGRYTLYPAQQPQKVGETPLSTLDLRLNRASYLSPLPYPERLVLLGQQNDLTGQSMVEITIFPLQYLPLQKKLSLVTSITLNVEGRSGYTCGDYLSEHISDTGYDMYQQMVENMVVNPEQVRLKSSSAPQPLGVGPGDYDYVIITQTSWVSAFQPLADWKTQKGIPAAIVTTSWIYNSGGYSGTNVQKIKAFVQDVYTNWGTIYILLGGDTDIVPCHTKTFSGVDPDPVPNDAYYADFDSDWICEVNIGRASVTGTGSGNGQIGNFINKILTYETNPPLTNYAKNAAFFGFDLDSWTDAEQCKISIKNSYIPASWTMTTVYDSQGGNHFTNVISALNTGQNLVNHADHSNNDCMGTGYVNHDWLMYSSDMDALTNGNKQTIFYSMGCDPAAYDVSNCIAEHFVRNNNGGGIAFVGNSRYGWYEYAIYDTLSMGFDMHFFQSLFNENLYHLGAAFSDHKNDGYQEYPGDEYYQYIYTELTLLGDPELPVWKENPSTFVVSHPSSIPLGSSSFTVHVQTTGGANIQNAYVCLWKGDEIYERGSTNSAGDVTFTILPETGGSMQVTVTKQNYLPSETTATVIEENLPPYQPSSPNPSNGATNVPISSDLSWMGGDPNPGDTITYDVYFGTSSTPPKVGFNQSATTYDLGTLNYLTTYYWKIVAWDSYGETTAGSLWVFTTKVNSPPVFGAPSPANGSGGNPLSFTWSIPINDPDSNTFSWSLQCSNGQTNSGTGATNGTKTLALSGLTLSMTYTVWVNATDSGGSGLYTRRWYTFSTFSDTAPPITTISLAGTLGYDSWYISPVTITLTATDDVTGVDYTMYNLDTTGWTLYANPFTVSEDTTHTIQYYSVDNIGNAETVKSADFKIDQLPPTTTHTFSGDVGNNDWYLNFNFLLNAVDSTSGVHCTYYKIDDGGWNLFTTPVVITTEGSHTLTYYSTDNAGNIEPMNGPFTFKLDSTAPEITLAKLQIDLFTIKFFADVNDPVSGVDSVQFFVDGTLQSNDTVAPYEWTWTGIGEYTVTATAYDKAGNSQSQSMSTPYSIDIQNLFNPYQIQGVTVKYKQSE